ncbi:MAG: hypothetical protein M1838_001665 [Thelocarpon superellum]|nr:MAG: hypothetical protein M1838_001665 [Thelocarpon superellum]
MALESFRRLNAIVSLYEPPKDLKQIDTAVSQTSVVTDPPTTILICGWMSANPRHVAKYSAHYALRYPGARILTVETTTPDFNVRSFATQVQRVGPAVDALRADADPQLLVHTFSNGGAHKFCTISRAYRQATGKLLSVRAMVIDSAPGRVTLEKVLAYAYQGRPKPLLIRVWVYFISAMYVGFEWLAHRLFRRNDVLARTRNDLNNPEIVPIKTPRYYIYSEADRLVGWKDVEDHAREAQAKGWEATLEKMHGDHVGHMRKDEAGYWDRVTRLWAAARS